MLLVRPIPPHVRSTCSSKLPATPPEKGQSRDIEVKRRFSAAHDISHTLLPTYRHTCVEDADTGRFGGSEEELLCDYGAAALLLDQRWILREMAKATPSLQAFVDLAMHFGASLHATAIQIAAAGIWDAAFVFWEEGFRKSDRSTADAPLLPQFDALGPPAPKWRVAARYPQEFGGCYIPRNKSVESTSLVAQCRDQDGATWGIELFEFGRTPVQLACENMYAPYRVGDEVRPRVISLLQHRTRTAPPSLSVQPELLW